jgi:hypothetical protein
MRHIIRRLATAIVGSGLLLSAATMPAAAATTAFAGHWQGTDTGDGSTVDAYITTGPGVNVLYTDDVATRACAEADSSQFSAVATGRIEGADLYATMRAAKCGNRYVGFTGFGLHLLLVDGGNADPSDDMLIDDFGEILYRVS